MSAVISERMAEDTNTLKGQILANLTVKVPFEPPARTFPLSHIIHADSVCHAHEIVKQGGYFVVNNDDIQLFVASTDPDVNFKKATEGKTPAFYMYREEGCKTFFAKNYKKLRVTLGKDGKTTDWILMKEAKHCIDKMASSGDFDVDKKALAGPMMTSSLAGENNNYEKKKPTDGWWKEKQEVLEALKNSPAYIRGRLDTLPKKRKPRDPKNCSGSPIDKGRSRRRTEWVSRKKKEKKEAMETKKRGAIEKEIRKMGERDLVKKRQAERILKIEELKSEKV